MRGVIAAMLKYNPVSELIHLYRHYHGCQFMKLLPKYARAERAMAYRWWAIALYFKRRIPVRRN